MDINSEKRSLSKLYKDIMTDVETVKRKFQIFYSYKQRYGVTIRNRCNTESAIEELNNLWKNNEDANIEYYFAMKELHTRINAQIKSKMLNALWESYIKAGGVLRAKLVAFNHKMLNKISGF